jgi:hypothetical protein
MSTADPKTTAGRAFVRGLNILLKFARLYGFEHSRTVEQRDIAWRELREAISAGGDSGLLLASTGGTLLIDGLPIEGTPAEKQFAHSLEAAGLGSIQFFPSVTQEELLRFVQSFPVGKSKSSELAEQLKSALAGAQGIRINEICFVATDSRAKEAGMAAQLAASSLASDNPQFQQWLKDPQRLVEMIAAAEGSAGAHHAENPAAEPESGAVLVDSVYTPSASESAVPGAYDGTAQDLLHPSEMEVPVMPSSALHARESGGDALGSQFKTPTPTEPGEEELYRVLAALTRLGNLGGPIQLSASGNAASGLHDEISNLPPNAQEVLKHALAEIASKTSAIKPDQTVLIQIAEHLAIRFALERFERGEVKVNAIRQMLDRMNAEIENLRKILSSREEKMVQAGLLVDSHRDLLDRQFWAAVPENAKRTVLLSEDAWCIPPRNIRSFVNDLVKKGDVAEAIHILHNYAGLAGSEDPEGRRKTAAGLSEMAELYAQTHPKLLNEGLRRLGMRLAIEADATLQSVVSAAFVRLSQEAANHRNYPAMEQALEILNSADAQRPGVARTLRAKMGIEERVPELLEEALRARQSATGLTKVLRLLPQSSMEFLAARFNRCSLRDDAEQVANLALDLGEEALKHLRGAVRSGPAAQAVEMVGLLSKLEPLSLAVSLPGRMKDFPRAAQDRIVRQLASSAGPSRCRILLELLNHVDPLLMPMVVDEIGVTGEREPLARLVTILDGDLPKGATPYLRAKAAEALGRIDVPESIAALKRILEARKAFRWMHPQELRIAAWQALDKLDSAWARAFLPKSGLDKADLALAPLRVTPHSKFVRQRRHTRVRLHKPVVAVSLNLKENCRLEIRTASLVGGVASIDRHLAPGTEVHLKLQIGLRHLQATALMRDYRAQGMSFEIVDMSLEERSKFRRLLAENVSLNTSIEETDRSAPASDILATR